MNTTPQRVLVLGATGTTGSLVCDGLRAEGHDVMQNFVEPDHWYAQDVVKEGRIRTSVGHARVAFVDTAGTSSS